MIAWREYTLGDLFKVKHGFAFKGEHFTTNGDLILLTPGNFKNRGGLHHKGDKEKYYSGDVPQEYILKQGDLLVAMTDLTQTAPLLGSPAIIPVGNKYLHNQRLGKIVDLNHDRILASYLFFLLNSESVRAQIKGSASRATVRHTSPSRIYEVKVSLPGISVQRKIAGILSAYDELVENSTRRLALLESVAQATYDHYMKDPHPSVKFASLFSEPLRNGVYKPKQFHGSGISIVNMGELFGHKVISDQPMKLIKLTDKEKAKATLQHGDLLFARRSLVLEGAGKCTVVVRPKGEITFESSILRCRLDAAVAEPLFYFHFFRSPEGRALMASIATRTAVSGITSENLARLSVPCPSPTVQKEFAGYVTPLVDCGLILSRQRNTLEATRDLLLLKLISGRLDVEELEIETGESLAEVEA